MGYRFAVRLIVMAKAGMAAPRTGAHELTTRRHIEITLEEMSRTHFGRRGNHVAAHDKSMRMLVERS
jgi:hypothetical protein